MNVRAMPLLLALFVLIGGCSTEPETVEPLPYNVLHTIEQAPRNFVIDFESDRLYRENSSSIAMDLYEFDSDLGYGKSNHRFNHPEVEGWPSDYGIKLATLVRSGEKLLTFSSFGLVFIWDTETKELDGIFKTNHDSENRNHHGLQDYAISPDNAHVATALGNENGLQIWNIDTLDNILTISATDQSEKYFSRFDTVSFSPNGEIIAAMQNNNTLGLWDLKSGKNIHTLGEINWDFSDAERSLQFSPDGKFILASQSGNLNVWNIKTGELASSIDMSNVIRAAVNSDWTKIVAAGAESDAPRQISIYDLKTGNSILRLPVNSPGKGELGGFSEVDYLGFSPNGDYIVSSIDGILQFWNVETATLAYTGPKVFSDIYFNANGSEMGIGNRDARRIEIYDLISTK